MIRSITRRQLTRANAAGWPQLAALYHYGTRDVPIAHGEAAPADDADLERRATVEPPPEPFKIPRGRAITLPIKSYRSEFPRVVLSRRTWRGFGKAAIPARDLGTLLDLTFGCQMEGQRQGVHVLFRTSPSGGACHPVEAYLLALNVRDVTAGLYHYSPRTRGLHRLRKGATADLASAYLGGQPWFGDAGAVVFMTALMPRVWWRYPHPRSYRAILAEVGHFCQTFCLVATWLRLAPFCTMALSDRTIERDLGIDGTHEVLLYAAGVGTRPRDGRWVQWPGNKPDVQLPDSRIGRRSRAKKSS